MFETLCTLVVDIGSNAVRVQCSEWAPQQTQWQREVLEYERIQLRLGKSAFSTGRLQAHDIEQLEDCIHLARRLASTYGADATRVVATSAMRNSSNRDEVIHQIFKETGIMIDVISGDEEAELVALAVKQALPLHSKSALLIDIGGGSTEVTLLKRGSVEFQRSYPLGTVRLLREGPTSRMTELARELAQGSIAKELAGQHIDFAVGTGGNLRRIGKLRRRLLNQESGQRALTSEVDQILDGLLELDYDQRVLQLGLRADRADVIVPATVLTREILHAMELGLVLLPKTGLKEGVELELLSRCAFKH